MVGLLDRETSGLASPSSTRFVPQQRRAKKTSRDVLVADKIADWTIRIGGIGVIVAVFGIMIFLAQTVVPLFIGAHVEDSNTLDMSSGEHVLMDTVDEYKTVVVSVEDTGNVEVCHIASGRALNVPSFDFGDATRTAFARTVDGKNVAFGFADGTLRLGRFNISASIIPGAAPEGLATISDNVVSREELLNGVWGPDIYVEPRTVDVHIRRLRKALNIGDCADVIRTVRAKGYALDSSAAVAS